ncbi:MAG: 4-hydroxy-3-methylbut-2-enyl diphosphate reductase [Coriobacteriales bacterium]|jgi:4-hydroxy-3-methylbut-2-enyl diphosphate reductase|nr:4-hydroxy-3-methylbut-2-enyl diphosphate reductase [Coriobacteriales bacterium]
MKVLLSRYAGACYGVERALALVDTAAAAARNAADRPAVYTLGPLIHNPLVVAKLEQRHIHVVAHVDDVGEGVIVIRSHGVAPQVIEAARAKGLTVVDATCPYVKKAQEAASRLTRQGHTVVIVGEKGHPEVEAIKAYAGHSPIVAQDVADLPVELPQGSIGVVVQTTQSAQALDAIVGALRRRGVEPLVKNTICFATQQRQQSAASLAKDVDAMIVVGGRNSGNTTRLYQICKAVCPNTHHIEQASELDSTWFTDVATVGVTAGASTPQDHLAAVLAALEAN